MHCFFLRARILDHKQASIWPYYFPEDLHSQKRQNPQVARYLAALLVVVCSCVLLCRLSLQRQALPLQTVGKSAPPLNFSSPFRFVSLCTAACALTEALHAKLSWLSSRLRKLIVFEGIKDVLHSNNSSLGSVVPFKPSRISSWLEKAKSMCVDRKLLVCEQPCWQMGSNLLSQCNLIVCLNLCMQKCKEES